MYAEYHVCALNANIGELKGHLNKQMTKISRQMYHDNGDCVSIVILR